jgi:hypothetical protein
MAVRIPRLTDLALVAALASAAHGCSHGVSTKSQDSATGSPDLAWAPDESTGQNFVRDDAGGADSNPGNPGRDDTAADSAVTNKDAGRESRTSSRETGGAGRDQAAGADGGEPSACNGVLSLGDYLMSAEPGLYSPMVMADLNRDGILDLVSAGRTVFGQGNGTFSDPIDFTVGAVSGMALGDLDGDGRLDMVTVATGVSVLLGKDDGTFVADAVYTSGKGSGSVVLTDLDGDGKLDVVTANRDASSVSVLLGKGDGTLVGNTDYPTGDTPVALLVADVNADGKLDVLTVNVGTSTWNGSTVSTLLGAGNGKLSPRQDTQGGADPGSSAKAVLGDLNGDGKLDLVVTSPSTTKVLLGNGDGRFAAPVSGTWGDRQTWVTVSDLNGDGMLDVVVLMAGLVRVLPGRGDGTFAAALDSPTSKDAEAGVLGDVNSDGKADLIVSMLGSGFQGTLNVLLGSGRGTFGSALTHPTGSTPSSLVVGDVNGDGQPDVVTASESGGTVSVLVGKGEGRFAANLDYTVGKQPVAVALGDLDGDGSLDIVTANAAPNDTSIATASVLLGKGDGTFATKRDFVSANDPRSLALGDLNGDGRLDIVTTNAKPYGSGTVNVLFGKGDGTFASTTAFQAGYATQGIALGDLNNDGVLDMVATNTGFEYNGSLTILTGEGDGTFSSSAGLSMGDGASSVVLGDLNDDGVVDIVVAGGQMSGVAVMLGMGDGTFAKKVGRAISAERANSLALGDLNGDGWLDVITTDGNPGMITVLFGQGDGTLSPSLNVAFDTRAQALADLNGDGRLDVIGLTASGVTVLLSSCR